MLIESMRVVAGLLGRICVGVLWLHLCSQVTEAQQEDHGNSGLVINSSCSQSECLRCDLGSSACVKCLHVMMAGTRECHLRCPPGYNPVWAQEHNIFGRVCQERSVLAMVSHREVWIIAGASALGAVCVGVFLGVFLVLHRSGIKAPPDSPPRGLPKSLQDKRPKTAEVVVKGKERAEFVARLRALRSEAPHILRMMAATRNRFRSGPAAGHDTPADAKTKACRAVVRDLSRVLCLLGLCEDSLHAAPKDWRPLLAWTERLLVRYKRQQDEESKCVSVGVRSEDAAARRAAEAEEKEEEEAAAPPTRTLFVTRQQQLKAEVQERRRQGGAASPPAPLLRGVGGREGGDGRRLDGPPVAPSHLEHREPFDTKERRVQPPSTDLRSPKKRSKGRIRPPSGEKRHAGQRIKDFINLNKNLWLRLMFPKDHPPGGDLEKGAAEEDAKASSNDGDDFDDDFVLEDDIPSQLFFDHIEAFAFDLPDEIRSPSPVKPDVVESTQRDWTLKNNKNSKNSILITNSNYKNNLNLYKNYKNSRLFVDVRPDLYSNEDSIHNHEQRKQKEKRPSRLRRLSSSILMKDNKNLSLFSSSDSGSLKPKRRRPLKRQNLVQKEKHSKVLQRYQNHYTRAEIPTDSDSTLDRTLNTRNRNNKSEPFSSFTRASLPPPYINNVTVTAPPPPPHTQHNIFSDLNTTTHTSNNVNSEQESISANFDERGYVQSSAEDSKIKILIPPMKSGKHSHYTTSSTERRNRRNTCNLYNRSKIISNV